MQEGDIYLVEIPSSGGHEQAGPRPAIIVQASGIERLPTVLIVPLTSKLRAADFPFTFIIEPDNLNNLDVVSVALVFQLRAIDKRRMKTMQNGAVFDGVFMCACEAAKTRYLKSEENLKMGAKSST